MKTNKWLLFLSSAVLLVVCLGYAVVHKYHTQAEMITIVIETKNGAAFEEKEYLDAMVSIDYPEQMEDLELEVQMRQRGNGTMHCEKKSYKIKLNEKADLLLEGSTLSDEAARDWVLLAEYYDPSNLRNYYTFFTASKFDSFSFVPEGKFAEVYFKDESGELAYQGVYLLCDQVEIDEARIDIDDTVETGKGFLIELVYGGFRKQEYTIDLMGANGDMCFDIRSQIDNEADYGRVKNLLIAVDAAIASGNQADIATLVDLDSCVDMYLIQEFTKNIDVGWGSFYIYCEAGENVLYFCPPWDFDHSAGIDMRLDKGSYEGLFAGLVETDMMQRHEWYQMLVQYDWFQDLVRTRWNENKDAFLEGIAEISKVSERYNAQFQDDYLRWCSLVNDEAMIVFRGANYQENAEYLIDWYGNRYLWLDNYFNYVM